MTQRLGTTKTCRASGQRDDRRCAARAASWGVVGAAVLTLLLPQRAQADNKPIIAVFNITVQGKLRLKADVLRNLTDYLASQLTAKGHYKVVPRDQLANRLRDQKKNSYKKCYQQSCQIAIGRELAANKSLNTIILKIGRKCVLTANVYDLRSSASESAATQHGKCSEEELLKSIDSVAAKLSGDSTGGSDSNTTDPNVKIGPIASVSGIALRWPPRCPRGNAKACFELARKMKEQDQGLLLALYAFVQSKRQSAWRVSSLAWVFTKQLLQGYVPRQTQLEAMLKQTCGQGRAGACYALAKLKEVEKNATEQVSYFKRACDRKSLAACTALGNAYRLGTGTAKNAARALSLYRRACDRKYLPGCTQLAAAYRSGLGTTKNESRGIALYRRACDNRYWTACQSLGFYYSYGKDKDYNKAVAVYRRACDAGNAQSCSSLAYMYKTGRGVAKNETRARAIYGKACADGYIYGCTAAGDYTKAADLRRKACDGGDLYACNSLAYMYKQGQGVGLSTAKSNAIYRRSCDLGNISACLSINDQNRVSQLYRQGCDGGNMFNCNALGDRYRYGKGVSLNRTTAVAMYRKACDGGYAYACNNLAYMYLHGFGVLRNETMARSIYMRACKKGNMTACSSARAYNVMVAHYRKRCDSGSMYDCNKLGYSYSRGEGVTANKATAASYYRRACMKGYMQGCANLAVLYRSGAGVARSETQAAHYYRKACAGGYRTACALVSPCSPGYYRNTSGVCVRSGGTSTSCGVGFYYNSILRRCVRSSSYRTTTPRCLPGWRYSTVYRSCKKCGYNEVSVNNSYCRKCGLGQRVVNNQCVGGNGLNSQGCRPGYSYHRAKNGKGFCCPPGTLGYYKGYTSISCRRTPSTSSTKCLPGWRYSYLYKRCKKCGYNQISVGNSCITCGYGKVAVGNICVRSSGGSSTTRCKPGFYKRGDLCVRRGY